MSFEVDAERVQSAATATAGTSRNLVSESDTMLRNLLSLQECWRGSAAQNFQAVINQWESAQKQLMESLNSIHGALNTAARQYDEVESANSRLFAP
ncbi:WXG100 family type VII secretion target [Brevibacterium spongiae]|uniref:ESAT-6-like protein n=1 Tax=Brevibacterium spongiae TaxID=2909672 RepID=A0ABY5SLR0_9MICO|nr:WXG100 family type VII secretion target [Brevibacterium spongiae]UVI35453.1 WXG100 family type VII secretion target [Brevibacterium spongiae]